MMTQHFTVQKVTIPLLFDVEEQSVIAHRSALRLRPVLHSDVQVKVHCVKVHKVTLTTMGDVEQVKEGVVAHRSVVEDVSRLGAVVHGDVQGVVVVAAKKTELPGGVHGLPEVVEAVSNSEAAVGEEFSGGVIEAEVNAISATDELDSLGIVELCNIET